MIDEALVATLLKRIEELEAQVRRIPELEAKARRVDELETRLLRAQGRSILDFIVDALRAPGERRTTPSLLPAA